MSKYASLAEALDASSTLTDDGHLVWTGNRDRNGVGRIQFNGESYTTNQAAVVVTTGARPVHVAQRVCDRFGCCHPDHIIDAPRTQDTTSVLDGAGVIEDPRWYRRAACAGVDVNVFHPHTSHQQDTAAARLYCAHCPVVSDCLESAMFEEAGTGASSREGVRGGKSPRARSRLAERRSAAIKAAEPVEETPPPAPKPVREPIRCGTRRGYQRHRRNKEEACQRCKDANNAADRRLRATGTTKELTAA